MFQPPVGDVDGNWGEDSAWSTSYDSLLLHSSKSSKRMLCGELSFEASSRTAYLTSIPAWTVHTRPHRDFQRIPITGVIYKARALSLCAYSIHSPFLSVPRFTRLRLCFTCWLYLLHTLLFDLLFNTLLTDDTLLHIFPFYNYRTQFTPRHYSSSSCPTASFL